MAFFNEFPNTRTYDKDLGWLIHVVGQLQIEVKTFIENNTINIPDQITWDITKQYTRNTLVIDYDGTAYLSKQPVPIGIAITNTDYWMPIFNYDDSINALRDNIAANERNHTTASAERHAGDLVWLGNALYKVTVDMPAGTAYIVGTNVELYTIEDYLLFLKGAIASEAQARQDADTALHGNIDTVQGNLDAEVLARQGADTTLQGNIDAEVLARQGADNALRDALQGNIDQEIQDRITGDRNIWYVLDPLRNQYEKVFSDFNNGTKCLFCGDSLGAGFGWFTDYNLQTQENDGIAALIRRDFPRTRVDNISVGGSQIRNAGAGSLCLKVDDLDAAEDYKYIFIFAGINDVYAYYSVTDRIGRCNNINVTDYTVMNKNLSLPALEYVYGTLHAKYPNARIFHLLTSSINSSTTQIRAYYMRDAMFNGIMECATKWGVNIIDFRKIAGEWNNPNFANLYYDYIHYNEAGYKFVYEYFMYYVLNLRTDAHVKKDCYLSRIDEAIELRSIQPGWYMTDSRNPITGLPTELSNFPPNLIWHVAYADGEYMFIEVWSLTSGKYGKMFVSSETGYLSGQYVDMTAMNNTP